MSHRTIWKYPIPVEDEFTIEMPSWRKSLTAQCQFGAPQMWWLVDPEAPRERVIFRVIGTGHVVTEKTLEYIGTFQLQGGALVFHVFEKGYQRT